MKSWGGTSDLNDQSAPLAVVGARLRVPASYGLHRERLVSLLGSVWQGRLAVVTGPAGSGKTTLLAQYAASLDLPVVWYHTEAADGDPRRFLTRLQDGLASSLGPIAELGQRWDSVEAAVDGLATLRSQQALLAIDDIQTLEGTASEAALERLAWFAPPGLGIVVASRRQPGFNLSRLRVADRLVEIDADTLRFRSWEVEQLFHDIYQEPLPPADLATLARRTQGWAAGLQLFHLATRGKPASERRQMVHRLASRSRLVREYLTHNVVADLPVELRQFLIDSCVLGRLTGTLCDQLLSRSGSAAMLEEIERQQIFLSSIDGGTTFRYHEVLRSHLEASLVDQIGEPRSKQHYARAGELLEASGACSEALEAYCRAGDEKAAIRLLSRSGAQVADDPAAWLDLLPSGLADHDPWLLLATARRHVAAGRWRQALAGYQQAEISFNGSGDKCRRERMAVKMWLEPVAPSSNDWVGVIREATRKDPLSARRRALALTGPNHGFAVGLSTLLAGRLNEAAQLLEHVAEDAEASPVISASAWLAAGIALSLTGSEKALKDLHTGREQAEDLGLTWLARLASCAELCCDADRSGETTKSYFDPEDTWGSALFQLLQGLGCQQEPDTARSALLDAAGLFRNLGAGVLEAWARAGAAVAAARAGHPDARALVVAAEAAARTTSTWVALATVYNAFALVEPARAHEFVALANQLDVDPVSQLAVGLPAKQCPSATVTCFSDFSFVVNGGQMDLAGVKPRVRSLVRLLALNSGKAVHREWLIDALWPGANAQTGTRNLQVAVSAARQLVEHASPGGALILREGDAYRLVLPEGAEVDVRVFDEQFDRSKRAKARGDAEAMRTALARCLDLYRGDVLAVEGPADWVQEARERYRTQAADVSQALAEAHLAVGEHAEAARVCELGLAIDRYRDQLWRFRAEALEGAGDLAAAARARHNYDEILRELGVATS